MAKFFTSDLHFGHANVINFCQRPYSSVKEMNEAIINQWNSQITAKDDVYVLGDVGINKKTALDSNLISKLNGKKHLILGNHDYGFSRLHDGKQFDSICNKYINVGWFSVGIMSSVLLKNGKSCILTHLPPSNEYDSRYSQYKVTNLSHFTHLSGHLHCHYRKKGNLIDVGFDGDLKLLSEDDIIALIEDERDFIPTRLTEMYKIKQKIEETLKPYERELKKGNLRKSENENLVLYNYTDGCVYDRAWNDTTLSARGIIFEKKTGQIIALPFKKFFNLGEMPETRLENLPNEPYVVTDKADGSLGIVYKYDNKWNVATRGSLSSEQAIKAQEILQKYNMDVDPLTTLLVEIIYPANKIVVNYGQEEKLVLLGAIDTFSGKELSFEQLEQIAKTTGIPLIERYNYTIAEMIELQSTLPKDREGFVVRFESGLRVKIKGSEYMRIHKMISQMSPLSFWETMKDGKVNVEYLQELPEEYRKDADDLVEKLESKYNKTKFDMIFEFQNIYFKIFNDLCTSYVIFGTIDKKEVKRAFGKYNQSHPTKYGYVAFAIIDNNQEVLDKMINKAIRPTSNLL